LKVLEIPVEKSVGMALAYDLTEIVPPRHKRAVFRRGHVIKVDDLEILRRIGKSQLKVLDLAPDEVHEDDAALDLARTLAGEGLSVSLPGEAWADVVTARDGLLKIDAARIHRINLLDDILVATIHGGSPVLSGRVVARAKIRGLAVAQAVMDEAHEIASGMSPVIEVLPYRTVRAGAVITGREIYEGRIKDGFGPLLSRRLGDYGSALAHIDIVPDEVAPISTAIYNAVAMNLDMVLVTGGGSPDDCTYESISTIADEVVSYGAPVSPGAMTILAYIGEIPIVGVPAGLLARPRGFLDLLLPRLLAGDRPTKADIAAYGYGGLCMGCSVCTFPVCPFGR